MFYAATVIWCHCVCVCVCWVRGRGDVCRVNVFFYHPHIHRVSRFLFLQLNIVLICMSEEVFYQSSHRHPMAISGCPQGRNCRCSCGKDGCNSRHKMSLKSESLKYLQVGFLVAAIWGSHLSSFWECQLVLVLAPISAPVYLTSIEMTLSLSLCCYVLIF